MTEACKIVFSDGVAGVFNNDGSPSSLYNEALEYFENQEEAIEVWQASYTNEYNEIVGKSPETSTLKDVLNFLSNYSISDSVLSSEEMNQVVQFMTYNNIPSLYDLNNKLNSAFKNEGNFEISTRRLVRSGLYTQEEANSLNPDKLLNILNKLASLASFTDVNVVTMGQSKGGIRKTTGEKTIFETYKTQSLVDIAEYALKNSPTKEEYDVLSTLSGSEDYNSVVSELESSSSLRSTIMGMVNSYRAVPKVFTDFNGKITTANLSEQTTLKNTILANIDPIELQADIEFLDGVSLEVWKDKSETIQRVVRGIERDLIKYNVDVIGLSDVAMFDREGTLVLLESASDMLINPTPESIQRFSEVKAEMISPPSNKALIVDDERLSGLNILYMETDMSPTQMFDNHSLIKVGDNIYHAVNIDTEEAYSELYDRFQRGELVLPTEMITTEDPFDVENFESTMQSIRNYVNSRETGITNNETVSLSQLIFGYGSFKNNNLPTTDPIESEDYLKTEFISDFYQYKLEEKLKGSDVYDKILKYFDVSDSDINFNSIFTPDITGLKYEKELRDYASLKKEGQIKQFSNTVNVGSDIDIEIINNPSLVGEISGVNFASNGDYLVTSNSVDLYARIGDNIYRKVYSNLEGKSVYQKVTPNTDGVYFNSNINFDTNLEDAIRILNEAVIYSPRVDTETLKEASGLSNKIKPETVEIEQSDLEVVQLLRDRGIEVPDIQEMISSGEISYRNESGEICANIGVATKFKKGHKWGIVKEIEGNSHQRGGVDLTLTTSGVEIRNNDSVIKAEKGMIVPKIVTSFMRGNMWEIVKEIKGDSHTNGGVDITLTKTGVNIKNNNSEVKAKYGLLVPNMNCK